MLQVDILLADIAVCVKQTFEVINQMQAEDVIGKYAIGGKQNAVDPTKLNELLKKFNLADKWAQFERKYLEGPK